MRISDWSSDVCSSDLGEIVDLQQLRDVVINEDGLRLGDIATVQLQSARLDMGRRLEGQHAVGLDIFRERNANLVEVSRSVLAEIEKNRGDSALRDVEETVKQKLGKDVTSSLLKLAEAGADSQAPSVLGRLLVVMPRASNVRGT